MRIEPVYSRAIYMKGMIIFINCSLKPKKWFDISIGCQIEFEPKNVDNKQILYNCLNRDQAISSKNPL